MSENGLRQKMFCSENKIGKWKLLFCRSKKDVFTLKNEVCS
jgi:hypothetical protein